MKTSSSQKYLTNHYSNNITSTASASLTRPFCSYRRKQGFYTCRSKVIDGRDQLAKKKQVDDQLLSLQQSALTQRQLKNPPTKPHQLPKPHTIKLKSRKPQPYYISNQSHHHLLKLPQKQPPLTIHLHNPTKQTTLAPNPQHKRKNMRDRNQQSLDQGIYFVKKLPTYLKGIDTLENNSLTSLRFVKKNNMTNKQNFTLQDNQLKINRKNFKQSYNNLKNKSILASNQNGIIPMEFSSVGTNNKGIDFTQKYYQRYNRIQVGGGTRSQMGYMSCRYK